MRPLLENAQRTWERPAFSVLSIGRKDGKPPRVRAESVRTDRWRYIALGGGKIGMQLFGQSVDPHELNNLAEDLEFSSTRKELKASLRASR